MKKLYSLATLFVVAASLVACSNSETPQNNEVVVQESQTLSPKEIVSKITEEGYIRMPLEISEEEAVGVYHIDSEIVEDYAISVTGIQPGCSFALVLKAKEGKTEEVKAIAEQVKEDRIGNAFYPSEVEAAENAELLVNGDTVALLIFDEEVKEAAIELYKELVK